MAAHVISELCYKSNWISLNLNIYFCCIRWWRLELSVNIFFFKNELAVRLNINVYYWKQTVIFKREHWHWYSLEIVNSEHINDRVVHSSDFYNKADRLRKQWTERYLFHNRKTRQDKAAHFHRGMIDLRNATENSFDLVVPSCNYHLHTRRARTTIQLA